MEKKVSVYRTDGYSDIKAICTDIKKFEGNIELFEPNIVGNDGKSIESLLIPLETIDHVEIRNSK